MVNQSDDECDKYTNESGCIYSPFRCLTVPILHPVVVVQIVPTDRSVGRTHSPVPTNRNIWVVARQSPVINTAKRLVPARSANLARRNADCLRDISHQRSPTRARSVTISRKAEWIDDGWGSGTAPRQIVIRLSGQTWTCSHKEISPFFVCPHNHAKKTRTAYLRDGKAKH